MSPASCKGHVLSDCPRRLRIRAIGERRWEDSGRHLGFSVFRLEDELAHLFGRPIDLVAKAGLHRVIRDDVLAQARQLYAGRQG